MRRVLLAALIAVGCSGATAPPTEQPTPKPKWSGLSALYAFRGFTIWSCDQPGPAVFARVGMDSLSTRATTAHEMSHAAFALSFPSCEAWHAWRQADPENELTMEALAYCAAIRQRVTDGQQPEPWIDEAVRIMVDRHGFEGLDEERARRRLLAVCR